MIRQGAYQVLKENRKKSEAASRAFASASIDELLARAQTVTYAAGGAASGAEDPPPLAGAAAEEEAMEVVGRRRRRRRARRLRRMLATMRYFGGMSPNAPPATRRL